MHYKPGKGHKTLDWQTGQLHLYSTGQLPQPGDLQNQQGVFIVRKGRTVRLHDVMPEDWKSDFDPDDAIEDPAIPEDDRSSVTCSRRHADSGGHMLTALQPCNLLIRESDSDLTLALL